ncbi:BTAD domain-containing putative transcriptional regulator, partial [Streptomyces sp. SID3343]|uniref:BTAD domain-containing putative transcriptional regulator n=1 Tax=Streptomyces sp. SID3343 TaxID=2690260 RepID=UPI0013BFCEA5
MSTPEAAPSVTFRVLGPLEAVAGGEAIPLKGPRHRAVLSRLLVARGRVVPIDRLVDDLWEQPPEGAVGAIRTFVSALRRALEPDRPPRWPARLLVTVAPGYALRAERDAVDAWVFEAEVGAVGALLAAGRAGEALARVDAALEQWSGPAYAEFAGQAWALGEATRLDGLRAVAGERRAHALLGLGRAAEAVPDLAAHATAHPLREDAWELLALALYRMGRQGEALAAVRSAREAVIAELGVGLGPSLRRLEADILAQAPHLTPRTNAAAATPSPTGPEAGREPGSGPGPGLNPNPGLGPGPESGPDPCLDLGSASASASGPGPARASGPAPAPGSGLGLGLGLGFVPTPAPGLGPEPGLAFGPGLGPEPEPAPTPVRDLEPGPESESELPGPVTRLGPAPIAGRGSGLGPEHGLEPEPEPGLRPAPGLESAPAPGLGPEAEPQLAPTPEPEPGLRTEAAPAPGSGSAPGPAPVLGAAPGLGSEPAPAPAPAPGLGSRPGLAPTQPGPGPVPGFGPERVPGSVPEPEPAPGL